MAENLTIDAAKCTQNDFHVKQYEAKKILPSLSTIYRAKLMGNETSAFLFSQIAFLPLLFPIFHITCNTNIHIVQFSCTDA